MTKLTPYEDLSPEDQAVYDYWTRVLQPMGLDDKPDPKRIERNMAEFKRLVLDAPKAGLHNIRAKSPYEELDGTPVL